jgi:hypothetical protein
LIPKLIFRAIVLQQTIVFMLSVYMEILLCQEQKSHRVSVGFQLRKNKFCCSTDSKWGWPEYHHSQAGAPWLKLQMDRKPVLSFLFL